MVRRMTEQERETFLSEPRVGVVSVASGDDRPPLTTPTWYAYQPGGELSFFTGTQGHTARKTRLIEQAGVLTFLVQQDQPPYKYVAFEGAVAGIDRPPSAEQMLAIVRRYLPEEYAQGFVQSELENPAAGLVLIRVQPIRWMSSDFSDNGD